MSDKRCRETASNTNESALPGTSLLHTHDVACPAAASGSRTSCHPSRTTGGVDRLADRLGNPTPAARTRMGTLPSRTSRPSLPLVRCYVTIFCYDISCQVRDFRDVRQVTIGLELAGSTLTRTLHARLDPSSHARARERSCNGSASDPAPVLGRGFRYIPGTEPSGDPRYARYHRRVRESTGGRANPELPGRILSHHSRLSAVAADAAGSLARDGAGVLHRQHPGGAAARRDVARHGRRV